ERTVRSSHEPGGRIRLTEVPHRAVIHEVRAAIRTELQIRRAVDPLDSIIREGLVTGVVEGKLRLLDLQRLAWPAEVHELDVMPGFRISVRRGAAEVARAGNQRGPLLHHPADKDARREVVTDHCDVGGLERDRCCDGLRRECEHRLDGHGRRYDERDASREGRTNGGTTAEI